MGEPCDGCFQCTSGWLEGSDPHGGTPAEMPSYGAAL